MEAATTRGSARVNPTSIVDTIDSALVERELEYTRTRDDQFVVELPGEKKLKTTCLLTVGRDSVRVEAFVCRHPDENDGGVHRYLLTRNRRLYGVHYTIDRTGDIYLVGRLPFHAVTADELDRVLGQVLEAADADFNVLLELGFAKSIRREWDWRVSRGESLANLKAFEHLIDQPEDDGSTDMPG
ncbi:YbjN domain-containing protein [Nocardiaceae bacterium YC2-7]|uniref:YbjN domain-containing protein n=1 Tax=Antrihabitans stalactiti TaxID=2584121 RepID=A0A848KGS3_9NOCA|nr:YbjN domain-containing protein [Antrihabitans stalactiti]